MVGAGIPWLQLRGAGFFFHSFQLMIDRIHSSRVSERAMKKPKATVACPSCHGTGQKELSKELAATLARFGAKSLLTTADLAGENATINAMSNRLETLRASKLLDRRRAGRFWQYFKTETAGGKHIPADPVEPTKKKAA